MRKITGAVIGLWISLYCLSSTTSAQEVEEVIDYSLYGQILQKYVNENGLVDYVGLKADRDGLDQLVDQIENAKTDIWSPVERKAFWINAYNILTLKLIVDKYPLMFGGIRTINFGRPWSITLKAAGQKLTLGDIEHEILRKWEPADPRIHFVINCASIGCPKLPNQPFYSETLDQQLDFEARRFINDPDKVRLERSENILYYSAIFSWFEEDFLVVEKDLLSYIKKYINEDDLSYINTNDIKLKKLNYDWSLNKQ